MMGETVPVHQNAEIRRAMKYEMTSATLKFANMTEETASVLKHVQM